MADFIFKISPNIVLGSYTASRLGQQVSEWGSKFMLIMDPILKEAKIADKITQSLSDRGIDYFVFDEISASADTGTITNALDLARKARVHGVIACGGGRTLAMGKAVCAMFNETKKTVYDIIDANEVITSPALPFICLPTTIRDGFIFTDRTPVTDIRYTKVRLLKTQNGLCRLVLWDPNLQISLSEKQMQCMSIEALSFAVEGYLSQKSSFFSDMLLEKGIQMLGYGLDGSDTLQVTTPQEVLMTQGGCMSSLGSSASSLGVANILSVAIHSRYRISRSLTTAILFPHIIEDAATFRADRLATLAKHLRACPQDASVDEAVRMLLDYVRNKMTKANLPTRFKDLSLSIEQLAAAVEDAGELDLMNYLPRSMTTDDLYEIVKRAF